LALPLGYEEVAVLMAYQQVVIEGLTAAYTKLQGQKMVEQANVDLTQGLTADQESKIVRPRFRIE
jgi:hypothetical protein